MIPVLSTAGDIEQYRLNRLQTLLRRRGWAHLPLLRDGGPDGDQLLSMLRALGIRLIGLVTAPSGAWHATFRADGRCWAAHGATREHALIDGACAALDSAPRRRR